MAVRFFSSPDFLSPFRSSYAVNGGIHIKFQSHSLILSVQVGKQQHSVELIKTGTESARLKLFVTL